MKIYVSGPMTGKPDLNKLAFLAAQQFLEALGHEVMNPHVFGPQFGVSEDTDLRIIAQYDIGVLLECDMIAMLPGWQESKGALAEAAVAHWVGIPGRGLYLENGVARWHWIAELFGVTEATVKEMRA